MSFTRSTSAHAAGLGNEGSSFSFPPLGSPWSGGHASVRELRASRDARGGGRQTAWLFGRRKPACEFRGRQPSRTTSVFRKGCEITRGGSTARRRARAQYRVAEIGNEVAAQRSSLRAPLALHERGEQQQRAGGGSGSRWVSRTCRKARPGASSDTRRTHLTHPADVHMMGCPSGKGGARERGTTLDSSGGSPKEGVSDRLYAVSLHGGTTHAISARSNTS